MMKKSKAVFALVLVFTLLLCWLAFFGMQMPGMKYSIKSAQDMRFGIDIRGGVEANFAPKDLGRAATTAELEAARAVLETRLDQSNILDRDVTIDSSGGTILVRFPWKSGETDFDPAAALGELGSMAHLTFRDPTGAIVLEGKNVVKATPERTADVTGSTRGQFDVKLQLSAEGRQQFAEATGRLIGQQISIFMDDQMISSPTVESKIDDDTCVITGQATMAEAALLANQINAGALPFALTTENFSTISPQLGSNALEVMLMAAICAFLVICVALILWYRASGVVAAISLLLQIAGIVIMTTWFQITVTLSGIAGIILSIGMGVDANIIVAERIREELRAGRNIDDAVSVGFKKAFSSVFDGNITVLIVAVIMLYFGSGEMKSFGYTLLFGIIMNFVAGVTATRLMTTSLIQYPFMRKTTMFLSNKSLAKKEARVFPFFEKKRVFFLISACIMALGIVMLFAKGMTLDIAFEGGTIVEYNMSETEALNPDDAAQVAEQALEGQQVTAGLKTDYATGEMRLSLSLSGGESLSSDELATMTEALQKAYPGQGFTLSSNKSVTAYYGQRFLTRAMIALALSALLIILYVWFSFRKIHGLSAGTMALLSLLHDILVVFFTFIIFGIPIGGAFVTVALTILGYSINDTIVIYDRIRENTQKHPGMDTRELVDLSISQSFTRSLNTNLAVFVSVVMIYVFAMGNGLDSMREFALPMAIGTISGCYSTVCIAGPLWTMWQKRKQRAAKG